MNKARRDQLLKAVPDILDYKTLLYIGANKIRAEMLDLFGTYRITILEVWTPNVIDMRSQGYDTIQGDVRYISQMPIGQFDIVMWWHGPEHIEKDALPLVLKGLYQRAKIIAIVACPWGIYKQGEVRGNPFEKHVTYLYPEFFEKLGWQTSAIGRKDVRGSNLLAWKRR